MRFNTLNIVALVFSATHVSALGSDDIVMAVDKITELSNDTNTIAMSLTSGSADLPQNGLKLVSNFKDIVTMVTADIATLGGAASAGDPSTMFKADAQADICKAFTGFVEVHQNLLKTVIGKKGLLSVIPLVGPPLALALRSVEGVVDKIAFTLISFVPTCADTAKADLMKLDGSLDDAIKAYSIPSIPGLPGLGSK